MRRQMPNSWLAKFPTVLTGSAATDRGRGRVGLDADESSRSGDNSLACLPGHRRQLFFMTLRKHEQREPHVKRQRNKTAPSVSRCESTLQRMEAAPSDARGARSYRPRCQAASLYVRSKLRSVAASRTSVGWRVCSTLALERGMPMIKSYMFQTHNNLCL